MVTVKEGAGDRSLVQEQECGTPDVSLQQKVGDLATLRRSM